MKMIDNFFKTLDEKLYSINRIISIKIMTEKNIKKMHKLMKLNKMIGEVIKECRKKI